MRLLLLLLLSCRILASEAQTTNGGIQGMIQDSISQKKLEYVTIGLKTSSGNSVKSTLSNQDGTFKFDNLKADQYVITFVSLGYQRKQMLLDLSKEGNNRDLGAIHLTPSLNQLKEVVVTTDKPIIKQEVDKLTYDLQADPESKSSSVMDMMRKVPLLSVDGDDNLQLKGDGNFRIFINGKPSSMMERNAKDVLKSMPAASIQSIEVITNPPSKYDAEGIAGIINIVTNKKVDNGYNASLSLNNRFPAGGPGSGGSLTFKQGKIGISSFGGANMWDSPLTQGISNRTTSGSTSTNLSQTNSRRTEGANFYSGAELSFELDSLNLFTGQFNLNGNRSDGNIMQQSRLDSQSDILQRYQLSNENRNSGSGSDAGFNYQRGFSDNKNRLLTLSYRYFGYSNEQQADLSALERFNYDVSDYRQFNVGGTAEQTFQIDYVHPVKKVNIEAGLKAIYRQNESDFQFWSENDHTHEFELDHSRTNTFDNRQRVFGAYNTYSFNLKNWSFKGGFRIEKTIIEADFISSSSEISQKYLNLVPTVNISRKFKNMSSMNFSFSQRLQRPGIYQLNPFIDRSNPNFESTGNPDLHPTTGNSLNLGYSRSKKTSINLMLGYIFFNDLIMPVSAYDPLTFITRNSFDNTGRARLINFNMNLNHPLSKTWNLTFNGRLAHGRVEGIVNEKRVGNEGFMFNISSSTSYRLEKGWRVNGSFFVHGPNLSMQGTSNSYFGNSLSVNKDLIKDKLSFSAASNNPMSKFRNNRRDTFGPDFYQTSNTQTFYRSFNMSMNYKFGKLKSTLKKNKRSINNDDVSNSTNP